jgi:hypothetical protein
MWKHHTKQVVGTSKPDQYEARVLFAWIMFSFTPIGIMGEEATPSYLSVTAYSNIQ